MHRTHSITSQESHGPWKIVCFLFSALLLLSSMALELRAESATGTVLENRSDDDLIKDFKRYFRKYKETPDRVEAVRNLEDIESAGVVKVLIPILKDKESQVVDAAIGVLAQFKTRPPIEALLAEVEKGNSKVRVGILQALEIGKYKGQGEAVTTCLGDREWQIRHRALRALVASGDVAYAEFILPLCSDQETAVRCAALEGLAVLKIDDVRAQALLALDAGAWQVRASAYMALKTIRHKDSIAPLIERLKVEEGRLTADASGALEALTGRFFGTRVELWERFWTTYKDRYEIPTDAELATLRAKQAERKAEYTPGKGTTSFHGIETPSRSILFVIDVSGSMEAEVIEKERFEDGDYPSMVRMDIVKTELARTVMDLETYVNFNILSYATDLKAWKKKLVPAKLLNKSNAETWCNRLEPIGGNSKQDLARAGLTGTANLGAGKTNTHGALMWALQVAEDSNHNDDYEVGVDTIYFLSDGRPTHGTFIDPDEILREVRKVNELRKVVIHTIALGEFKKSFMERLAKENGGNFVDLGR